MSHEPRYLPLNSLVFLRQNMNTAQVQVLKISIMKNPIIEEILKIAPSLRIPNWYLGAGCIAQTIWNEAHGFDPIFGIKDYDIVYFDASDLSYETEDRVIKPVKKALSHLNVPIDVDQLRKSEDDIRKGRVRNAREFLQEQI